MASPEEDQKFHHKVNLTASKPFSKTFKSGLKETFFPDDPFRHLKKTQSSLGRVGFVLKYYLPILEWGAKYTLRDLRYDVLSGITIASLAIPQGISYARLADLPPVIGLCGTSKERLEPIKHKRFKITTSVFEDNCTSWDSFRHTGHCRRDCSWKEPAILKNYQIDGNKEMIAFGMMNIVGSFTSCYITTGPFSKSAVNTNAGCRTPMSNIVASICIMLVLLFLAPWFCYTPLVALSSIIIVAMLGLIEYEEAYHLFKVDKLDFCICMTAFLGVILVSMDVGLMISVGLSILRALLYVARPSTFKLGNIPNTTLYRDMEQYPYSTSVNGILILQLGISRWVEEEENTSNKGDGDLQYLILDMGGVTSIDAAGIGMLEEVLKDLEGEASSLKVEEVIK
ncbi:putative sulfate transporter 3.5 [Acorus calamus]|uniref:Sulfate transporter 3.5 n=1 Tax=Acorus calamus TaxID=4465 RepID=A0AAV9C1T0_ACOCL|nr:putative sulfate transporter 3.5 [Acorus calamus]